jgi:hypothetical protein
MILERLRDLVRVQLQIAHQLPEGIPFHLREREADVLIRHQGVIVATRFLEGASDHAVCRLSQFVLRYFEIYVNHGRLPRRVALLPAAFVAGCTKGLPSAAAKVVLRRLAIEPNASGAKYQRLWDGRGGPEAAAQRRSTQGARPRPLWVGIVLRDCS